ncbi:MAG: GGDEF domain-containing protein [Thiohalomonadaceae bacterium]
MTSLAARMPTPDTVHLTLALQTTLELEPMLALFAQEANLHVPFDGVVLRSPTRGLELQSGKRALHRCAYHVTLMEDSLGEIEFARDQRFGEADLVQLEMLLSAFAYPLRNALAYRDALLASRKDALTGVGNRAAFEEALAREVLLARRAGQALALLALDLDHFKRVNDLHGHQTGDGVLKEAAARMQAALRATDLLFRYGGEEFVVLLGNTDEAGAALVAERIRQAMAADGFCRGSLPVTVSIGIAVLAEGDHARDLFARADAALYRAKAAGRNRVEAGV